MSNKAMQQRISSLSREVLALRSLVIGAVLDRDPEGEYQPKFVREILKAVKSKPQFEYRGEGTLLRQLKQLK